jgi:phenylacetate-CoA ligase
MVTVSTMATSTASVPRKSLWSRPPLEWVRRGYLLALNYALTRTYRFVRSHYSIWYRSSQLYNPILDRLAHLNAYLLCAWAKKRVPAYRQFLADSGHEFRLLQLDSFPETSKESYVQRYGFAERCRNGRIPVRGTVVDESAGSSGTPYNWVRSAAELQDVHRNSANWVRFTFPTERLFALNAFSMGAWATGTNMGIALAKVCIVKSTGPDIEKIADTIERFGPEYDYLVTAYPPFLKHVVDAMDARGFDWTSARVYGAVGGEGMTEAMRDYLEKRLVKVRSGYGLSDVQFGIAGENDLTVRVRKLLVERADVRDALLGPREERVPMVFQYNPLDNYIEINADGELVITATNLSILSPKLRYNVGDEGFTMSRPEVVRSLVDVGAIDPGGELPLGWASRFLFLYGRRDSTISYMGANIYPIDVEYGLYRNERSAALIEGFRLELQEDRALESRPVVHVNLRATASLDPTERERMVAQLGSDLVDHLRSASRDFAESLREDPSAGEVRVVLHDHGTGPFARETGKIKNVYLVPGGS